MAGQFNATTGRPGCRNREQHPCRFVQKVSNPVQYYLPLNVQNFKVKYSAARSNPVSARLDMHPA
jgi:hypothetical protein